MGIDRLMSDNNAQGIAFLSSAGIVYAVVSAACSSPQTTELNADIRAATLMKWVYIGLAQSVLFVAAAAAFDRKHRPGIVTGGATAVILMWWQYRHARDAGLKGAANGKPGTEYYGN